MAITHNDYLSFYVEFYLSQSKPRQEIIRYLLDFERKKRRGLYKGVFPCIEKIRKFAQCCDKTVQRFNKRVQGIFFLIRERVRPNRSKTSNEYFMEEKLFEALCWLDRRNLLRVAEERKNTVIREAKVFESRYQKGVSPPPVREGCPHPSLTPSLTSKEYKECSYVHQKIKDLPFDLSTKVMLSKYPEYAIVSGLEDVKWYLKLKKKVDNPIGLVLERIRNKLSRVYK